MEENRLREIIREEIARALAPQHAPSLQQAIGCPVCGIGSRGETLGYVCSRTDCPTRMTWITPSKPTGEVK